LARSMHYRRRRRSARSFASAYFLLFPSFFDSRRCDMKLVTSLGMILLSCAAAGLPSRDAYACGGCFHGEPPPNTPPSVTASVVTGHRMALSISPQQTVLWDQVQYAGDPKDFAWVLPVGPGAVIEQASDAWFESLEAVTATRVESRVITCPPVFGDSNGTTYQEGSSAGCGLQRIG
jgi:hypothetical protein